MTRRRHRGPIATLAAASPGVLHVVAGPVATTPAIRRRLAELGVREGAQVVVRGRTSGGGAILAVDDARIAVSGQLLGAIPAVSVTAGSGKTPVATQERAS